MPFCSWQTHGFKERRYEFSATGECGMGDSWGALAVPYLLAKYVFPLMQHVGWVGLREAELLEKARPYSLELRANWARLKVANVREGTGNGRSLKKDRWCDGLLFRAQVLCMAEQLRVNWAVTRLAVMGFVRLTCSRAGAMGRDWAGRAGLQVIRCVVFGVGAVWDGMVWRGFWCGGSWRWCGVVWRWCGTAWFGVAWRGVSVWRCVWRDMACGVGHVPS